MRGVRVPRALLVRRLVRLLVVRLEVWWMAPAVGWQRLRARPGPGAGPQVEAQAAPLQRLQERARAPAPAGRRQAQPLAQQLAVVAQQGPAAQRGAPVAWLRPAGPSAGHRPRAPRQERPDRRQGLQGRRLGPGQETQGLEQQKRSQPQQLQTPKRSSPGWRMTRARRAPGWRNLRWRDHRRVVRPGRERPSSVQRIQLQPRRGREPPRAGGRIGAGTSRKPCLPQGAAVVNRRRTPLIIRRPCSSL